MCFQINRWIETNMGLLQDMTGLTPTKVIWGNAEIKSEAPK